MLAGCKRNEDWAGRGRMGYQGQCMYLVQKLFGPLGDKGHDDGGNFL